MNYLGIDVHKRESQVAVLDDDGEVDEEIRVENANLDEVAEQYAGSQAVIEATSNYYTIYDTLDEHLDVVVADPQQTKAIGIAEVKNDWLGIENRDATLQAQFGDPLIFGLCPSHLDVREYLLSMVADLDALELETFHYFHGTGWG